MTLNWIWENIQESYNLDGELCISNVAVGGFVGIVGTNELWWM